MASIASSLVRGRLLLNLVTTIGYGKNPQASGGSWAFASACKNKVSFIDVPKISAWAKP